MFIPRVIPVLLLKGQGLVKTLNFNKSRYIGDPINAVRIFNDLQVDELVFLDILASKEKRSISVELVKKIGDEAYMPFAVGGGIRDTQTALELINAGAEKVVINTAFNKNPSFVKELSKMVGNQSVIVSMDVKKNWFGKYNVWINGGREKVKVSPLEIGLMAEEYGAGELMVNSIDQDGKMSGYDLNLIHEISSAVGIPVVACGGAGNLGHFKEAIDKGAHAVAAGSVFVYHGARNGVLLNYPEKKELKEIFS